ncbi:MAG: homogentisate 1,2-dioxygenase [Candidatus Melainabacteria bacterium]
MNTPQPGYPLVKGQVARQAHVGLPPGTVEEEHGRDGFFGPVSHLYRQHAPTGWTRIEGPLKPMAFDCGKIKASDWQRVRLLENDDVAMAVVKPVTAMATYYRNADADEVWFIHEGGGVLETDYGPLTYTRGDYLVIPRGTTYRFLPAKTGKAATDFYLLIESNSRIRQPERGLMGQHALYDPAVIVTPEPQPHTPAKNDPAEWEVQIQRCGEITSVFYPFCPLDVVGWKGDLTVWKLSVGDIRPVMSHRYHLAPSVHSTFVGSQFIICTFVPRPLEEDADAVRVPFYHRNIDYDEVLFYHDGDFFSRDNIKAGMLTLHPQGIHHGPHPGAEAASHSKTRTDEIAVMLDTRNPLRVTEAFRKAEWPEYHLSWQTKPVQKKPGKKS